MLRNWILNGHDLQNAPRPTSDRRSRLAARIGKWTLATAGLCAIGSLAAQPAAAADSDLKKALGFTPFQSDVEYDQPSEAEIEKCELTAISEKNLSGWAITNGAGQTLRRFVDTNGDKSLDQWCYYRNGVEVYRDIDGDFDGKPDQYRWLGTAGTRWGIDRNEDGVIEAWRQISAEEVTSEVVAAIQTQDKIRFQAVLMNEADIAVLGLDSEQADKMSRRVANAVADFAEVAKRQTKLSKTAKWIYFGGSRPSVIPAGTNGSTKDLYLYDNVSAIIDDAGKHGQVPIGTLVRVDQTWKLIDLPATLADAEANAGYFFQASMAVRPDVSEEAPDDSTAELRKWIDQLEDIDNQLAAATPTKAAQLHAQRADVIEELIAQTEGETHSMWIRQFADTVGAAVQSGAYPTGPQRLAQFYNALTKDRGARDDLAYVKYQIISANYAAELQKSGVDYAKVQEQHEKNLETFIDDFPTSADTADAMLQLGLTQEFAGQNQKALTWYRRITDDFPQAPLAAKAAGAAKRLEIVGKPLPLSGKTLDSESVDLARMRGKVVVVHTWASWCDLCKQDIETLKKLQVKYARKGLTIVGINFDESPAAAKQSVSELRITWPQLQDAGLDSPLANQLGILTLPTMYLIDAQGRVVRQSVHISELDQELGKLIR